MFAAASHPVVLVDACCGRFGMQAVVRKLVESCGIRFFTTPMGKALLDEHHPLYGGCYAGANSLEAVRKEVESSDFALYVGALKSDFNSGSFSVGIDPKVVVELHSFTTTVGVCPSFPFQSELMISTRNTQRPISDISSLSSSPRSRKQMLNHRARR
jgi:pyruvate decarboxylase